MLNKCFVILQSVMQVSSVAYDVLTLPKDPRVRYNSSHVDFASFLPDSGLHVGGTRIMFVNTSDSIHTYFPECVFLVVLT